MTTTHRDHEADDWVTDQKLLQVIMTLGPAVGDEAVLVHKAGKRANYDVFDLTLSEKYSETFRLRFACEGCFDGYWTLAAWRRP